MMPQFDGNVARSELQSVRQRRLAVFLKLPVAQVAVAGAGARYAVAAAAAAESTAELSDAAASIAPPLSGGPGAEADRTDAVKQLTAQFADAHAMKPLGVALSGGGIRSATFNLGVLQGLAERGLLRYVDYLSTVSGGGYIGSWLHGVVKNGHEGHIAQAEAALSPRRNPVPRSAVQDPVTYLRTYSNYLAPRPGLFSVDTWVIASIWARNVLLNQLILAPTLAAGVLLILLAGFGQQFLRQFTSGTLQGVVLVALAAVVLATLGGAVLIAALNLRQTKDRAFPRSSAAERTEPTAASELADLVAPAVFVAGLVLACGGFDRRPLSTLIPLTIGVIALFAIFQLFGGFPDCYRYLRTGTHDRSIPRSHWFAPYAHIAWMAPVAAAATMGLVIAAFRWLLPGDGPGAAEWQRLAFGPPVVSIGLVSGAALLIGLMGADYPDAAREWLARVGAIIGMICAGWIAIFLIAVFGPVTFAALTERYLVAGVSLAGAWVATIIAGIFAGRSTRLNERNAGWGVSLLRTVAAVAPPAFMIGYLLVIAGMVHVGVAAVSDVPSSTLSWTAPRESVVYDIAVKGSQAPSSMQVAVSSTSGGEWAVPWLTPVAAFRDTYWRVLAWQGTTFAWLLALFAGCAAVAAVAAARVNINEFSMHHFYKNRLVRCYLGASHCHKRRPNPVTGFDPADDFPISRLTPDHGYTGPYAIVNAALNVNADSELAKQERRADSFVFTPSFCGFQTNPSPHDARRGQRPSGFAETRGFTSPDGPALGTTMAISGAAANPNAGARTSGPMAFLLTVFDARLGWWLGNPRDRRASRRSGPDFAWGYLFRELFARTTARDRFVNISDGGHFDNLGLYELVRRRCRYIIIGDAEQDPEMTFDALGGAIRKCRADFGVEIDLSPEPIRGSPDRSRAHCVVGTIRYPEFEQPPFAGLCKGTFTGEPRNARGWILYVKTSLTGDEPADVLEYHREHPEFPHQSTADQFFTESQFESYRRLGLHAIRDAFEGIPVPGDSGEQSHVLGQFQQLTQKWYSPIRISDEAQSRLADAYSSLIRNLRTEGETLRDLGQELLPTAGAELAADAARLTFTLETLQLMENVYTEFGFEHAANRANPRNAGWMNVFRRWAKSRQFSAIWEAVSRDYHPLFGRFIEELRREDDGGWPDRD